MCLGGNQISVIKREQDARMRRLSLGRQARPGSNENQHRGQKRGHARMVGDLRAASQVSPVRAVRPFSQDVTYAASVENAAVTEARGSPVSRDWVQLPLEPRPAPCE